MTSAGGNRCREKSLQEAKPRRWHKLQSYSSYFTVPELKTIAKVFGLETAGKRETILILQYGGIQDYDKIALKLTYEKSSPIQPSGIRRKSARMDGCEAQ